VVEEPAGQSAGDAGEDAGDHCEGDPGVARLGAMGVLRGRVIGYSLDVGDESGASDEMAAFTFGYAEKDLIELGFDAGRGRGGVRAYVPREILLNSPELMEIGTLLSPAASSAGERLYRACQLARDFTFIGHADQRHLWTHFVLPQAFAHYPFDAVIVEVESIHSFGLP
jgi:hypothetical protein